MKSVIKLGKILDCKIHRFENLTTWKPCVKYKITVGPKGQWDNSKVYVNAAQLKQLKTLIESQLLADEAESLRIKVGDKVIGKSCYAADNPFYFSPEVKTPAVVESLEQRLWGEWKESIWGAILVHSQADDPYWRPLQYLKKARVPKKTTRKTNKKDKK